MPGRASRLPARVRAWVPGRASRLPAWVRAWVPGRASRLPAWVRAWVPGRASRLPAWVRAWVPGRASRLPAWVRAWVPGRASRLRARVRARAPERASSSQVRARAWVPERARPRPVRTWVPKRASRPPETAWAPARVPEQALRRRVRARGWLARPPAPAWVRAARASWPPPASLPGGPSSRRPPAAWPRGACRGGPFPRAVLPRCRPNPQRKCSCSGSRAHTRFVSERYARRGIARAGGWPRAAVPRAGDYAGAVTDPVDVPALIRARLPELSPNDRRIAAWLLEHESEAPFQTAESLARAAGVSKAAVVRFGSRLGFGGYAGLSEAMAGAASQRLARQGGAGPPAPHGHLLDRWLSACLGDLEATRNAISDELLDTVASLLLERRRTHLRVRAAQVGEPGRVRLLPAQPDRPERAADRLGHRLAGRPAARRARRRPPARRHLPALRAHGGRGRSSSSAAPAAASC